MANLLLLLVTSLCVEVWHSQAAPVNWGRDPYFKNSWPDPSNASLDIVVSLMDCAAVCSSRLWCSSFFYLSPRMRCLLFEGLYVVRRVLQTLEGAEYYRLVSDSCPIQNCYYLSRPDNLCFHLDLSDSAAGKNYNQSKKFCKDNGGRLAILDTLSKNQWIAKVLRMHNPNDTSLYLGAQRRGSGFAWSNDQAVAAKCSKEGFWRTEYTTSTADSIVIQVPADGQAAWIESNSQYGRDGVLCEYIN